MSPGGGPSVVGTWRTSTWSPVCWIQATPVAEEASAAPVWAIGRTCHAVAVQDSRFAANLAAASDAWASDGKPWKPIPIGSTRVPIGPGAGPLPSPPDVAPFAQL